MYPRSLINGPSRYFYAINHLELLVKQLITQLLLKNYTSIRRAALDKFELVAEGIGIGEVLEADLNVLSRGVDAYCDVE